MVIDKIPCRLATSSVKVPKINCILIRHFLILNI